MVLFILLCSCGALWAHGGEKHEKKTSKAVTKINIKSEKLELIQVDYDKNIKPIFQRSCFNCHSNQTEYPWYYKLPIAKQIMNHHVTEAKSHIDFSNGYPFKSHETKLNDLKSIKESISDGHMPPWYYLLFNKRHALTKTEIDVIDSWVERSIEVLK